MESRTGIRLYPPLLEATFISISPEETRAIGRIVGEHAAPGDVVLLTGELGTGKTCLTQGILHGLGSDDLARSPTFVLISEHRMGECPCTTWTCIVSAP